MRFARSAAPRNRDARTFGGRGGSGTSGNVLNDTQRVCKFSSSSSGGKQRVAPSPRPQARTIRRRVRGVILRIARYVVAGFKSSMRAARGSSLSSIIGYSTPGSSSSKGPSSKYSTWGHVESSTGGSEPFHPMMDMGSAFVCDKGSSLRPFVACAALSPTFRSTCPKPSTAYRAPNCIVSNGGGGGGRGLGRLASSAAKAAFAAASALSSSSAKTSAWRQISLMTARVWRPRATLAIFVEASTRAGNAFVFVSWNAAYNTTASIKACRSRSSWASGWTLFASSSLSESDDEESSFFCLGGGRIFSAKITVSVSTSFRASLRVTAATPNACLQDASSSNVPLALNLLIPLSAFSAARCIAKCSFLPDTFLSTRHWPSGSQYLRAA
mmetsp:Transcript_19729/g.58736  ORF Transcript_19729/g.58736 Transcript_19729/m.58736 type:complete len:384 (+) Transcript_19729:715-1866(+)